MGRVFLPKTQAIQYTPQPGETFEAIVASKSPKADPSISCDEVALFNWGTKESREVLRALIELVGCRKMADNPYQCELDPARGLVGKIWLPRIWKKLALAYEVQHKLVVKRQLPATAVSITSLDPWFLPGEESCVVSYALEGIEDRAKLLDFDVYASNYCNATAKVNGEFVDYSYTPTPDVPVLQKSISAAAPERSAGGFLDWKGESEAVSGVLAKRSGKSRYINVASSPYSVVLKYAKTAHKTAFVNLHSFWPRWSGDGAGRAVVPDSLKIKWTTKNCPGGLQGQIQVFDKDGIVYRNFLPAAKTGNGDQEFDWSADGQGIVKEDRMPYRAQVQLHTDKDTDDGFAIAAMHTEVRLFTHPEIGTHDPDHEQEPQVLELALAPFYAGPAPPEDSAKGRKLRLAKAGYHPGPVEDGEKQPSYIKAVREFQRDHVKPGSNPPERLKSDGAIDGPAKTAIAALAPGRRPLFAKADKTNLTADAAVQSALKDKATGIVVWVDDRHNYTGIRGTAAKHYLSPNMDLENYYGSFGGTDIRQSKDQAATCRPWIPLEVSLPVMRKSDALGGTAVPNITDASRAATGPLRVDWTFRDLPVEYAVDTTQYRASRGRPLKYLTDTFTAIKGAHNGKDAWNCTTALGGIRGADYHKAPFGVESESLMPWKAHDDSGVKVACSVAHDDLGQDEKQLFATHLGKAGIYFHPSIIGGDGYQLRAQVSFRDLPSGATHPNWKVLRDRYDTAKLPQVHSAPLRLWRKDTLRAHVLWAKPAESHWGNFDVAFPKFYEPGMIHFEYEGGASVDITVLTSLITEKEYLDLAGARITGTMGTNLKTDHYAPKSDMKFSPENVWPWWDSKHFGVQWMPPPKTQVSEYEDWLNNDLSNDSWDPGYGAPLILLLLARAERNHGLMRGHFIAEFRATPQHWLETYHCSKCATPHILVERDAAGGSGVGEPCRVAVCHGTLQAVATEIYTCDVCGFSRRVTLPNKVEGSACTQLCTGTLQLDSSTPVAGHPGRNTTVYQCDLLLHQKTFNEADADVGQRAGQVCGTPCTGHMHGDPATKKDHLITPNPRNTLGLPGVGQPLGALWNFFDGGPRVLWAHEVGHHKQLQHAADVIDVPAQHDHTHNSAEPALNPPNKVSTDSARWDRTCIMGYVSQEAGDDAGYFCGKCLLKLRGWKVEGSGAAAGPHSGDRISNPAQGVSGP